MIEFVVIAFYIGVLFAAAIHAFLRPRGVYWRSAAGLGIAFLLSTGVWWLSSPVISGEAGFGAFAVWLAAIVLAAVIAIAACIAATLRHALNALGARVV